MVICTDAKRFVAFAAFAQRWPWTKTGGSGSLQDWSAANVKRQGVSVLLNSVGPTGACYPTQPLSQRIGQLDFCSL